MKKIENVELKSMSFSGIELIREVTGQPAFGKSKKDAMIYVPFNNTVYANSSKVVSVGYVELDDEGKIVNINVSKKV